MYKKAADPFTPTTPLHLDNKSSHMNILTESPLRQPELLRIIFSYLSLKQRSKCRIVSRTWSTNVTYAAEEYTYILDHAIMNGSLATVDHLMRNKLVDPSRSDNDPIRSASYEGHLAIVDRLLQDPRVDPTIQDDCEANALQIACCENHLEVVDRLLQDPRVELNAPRDNTPLYIASVMDYLQIVRCILREPPTRLDLDVVHDAWSEASERGSIEEVTLNYLFDYLEVNNYHFSQYADL